MRFLVLTALLLGACKDPEGPAIHHVDTRVLDAPDQNLPVATVGTPYDTNLLASGGSLPFVWRLPEWERLPGGLVLGPNGRIAGTPTQAGEYEIQAIVTDAAGREKRPRLHLTVNIEPQVVQCGDTLSGHFTADGWRGINPDWPNRTNVMWMAVELPPDQSVTRVELQWKMPKGGTVYVEKPAEQIGSWDLDENYVATQLDPYVGPMFVNIDAGTNPSLSTYNSQPLLPFLVVSGGEGDWALDVVCTEGPVFVRTSMYPTEMGEPLEIDYDVYGDQTGVRIFTEDELPDWMIWDENTGTVTGTAMEPGGWEFTVVAEDAKGNRREEPSIIGVFEVKDLSCDESQAFLTEETYFDGEFSGYYDPKGYQIFRLPLQDVDLSSVELSLYGSENHYLGTALPDPGWLKWYPEAERAYTTLEPAHLTIDPHIYPAIKNYLEAEEMYITAASTGGPTQMHLQVSCPDTPRANLAALPVFEALVPGSFQLEALGSRGPYGFAGAGFPTGITVSPEGLIEGSTGLSGTSSTQLTVADKDKNGLTETYPFFVSEAAACEGATIIDCGDTVVGTFTKPYYSDPAYSSASTETFCMVYDLDTNLGFTVEAMEGMLRVDVVDPGATTQEMIEQERGTYVAFVDRHDVEGIALNPWDWPNVLDYRNIAVRVAVRAYDDGDYKVTLTCE